MENIDLSGQPTLLTQAEIEAHPLDARNKDTEDNFNQIIKILTGKGLDCISLLVNIYHISCCSNHFGMTPQFIYEQIDVNYGNFFSAISDDVSSAYQQVQKLIKEVYRRDKHLHGTYPVKIDETSDTPTIPEFVYESLPPLLKQLSTHFSKGREQDIFLLSSLVVLSSAFPLVKGIYDNKEIAASLFLLICAPASAGKGIMTWARRLGEDCHKHYEEQYAIGMQGYNEDMKAYNAAQAEGSSKELPEKPERKLYFIPANSTSSKLIQTLKANENFGVILETETDTLITALKSQHGNFSDILRKAFHGEPLELLRKTNDEYISMEKSFLSVALSGTPNQLKGLISSVENGFFSRFLFYDFPLDLTWKNVFDCTTESPDGDFKSASVRLLLFMQKLTDQAIKYENGIRFRLTQSQEQDFHNWFTKKQVLINEMYGSQLIASIRRLGLIAFRISMILTTLRHEKLELSECISCKDEDFNAAMNIVSTCLQHSINVYSRLKNRTANGTLKDKKKLFFSKLPDSFNRTTYIERAALLNIKDKTAEYYIAGYIKEGTLARVEHNNYMKL